MYFLCFPSFPYFWPRLRLRPRPVQAMEMKKFSGILPSKNDLYLLGFASFLIFAAANAAATTRSSDGNEKVFKNFTPENDLICYSIY